VAITRGEDFDSEGPTTWSLVGMGVAESTGVSFLVTHVGLFGVGYEGAQAAARALNEAPAADARGATTGEGLGERPHDGYHSSLTADGDPYQIFVWDPSTFQEIGYGIFNSNVETSARYEWHEIGLPDGPIYAKLTRLSEDGTTRIDFKSEYPIRPFMEVRTLQNAHMFKQLKNLHHYCGDEDGFPVESPCEYCNYTGFVALELQGTGSLGDATQTLETLEEKYGEENVVVDYFRAYDDTIYLRGRINKTRDSSARVVDHLYDFGVDAQMWCGIIDELPEYLSSYEPINPYEVSCGESRLVEVTLTDE